MAYLGQSFATGNSVINQLPAGSQLAVIGKGQAQDSFIPVPVKTHFDVGERVMSKHGPATVVRMTSRLDVELEDGDTLYVADGTNVVRVAAQGALKPFTSMW